LPPVSDRFERVGAETKWEGRLATVRVERWRHEDGEEVEREVVGHPGAVAVVAHDERNLWLVRQPREPIGDPGLLELPAGKLDVEDEPPLDTAKRELAEEVGKAAETWEELDSFYTSPGFSDERVIVYLATGLSDVESGSSENERIEIVPWPLDDLERAIKACEDAKSLIGLLWLKARRA
jgi:8-oxo-dGTP pyrophosphatase MutT (NUDIX family)